MANPLNKWRLDVGSGNRAPARTHDSTLNPPGFGQAFGQSSSAEHVNQGQQQQHLMSKRAWDMALQPVKSLPMNMM